MKKITLLLIFGFIVSLLSAQVRQLDKELPPTSEPPGLVKIEKFQKQNTLKGGGDIFWHEEFDWGDSTSGIGWYLPEDWSVEDPTDVGYNWHWANDTLKGIYTNEAPIQSTSQGNGFLALNLDGYNQDLVDYTIFLPVDNSIVSPVIDCSEHSSVLVRVEQDFRYWSSSIQLFEVTNDNGVHWATFDMEMGTLSNERVGGIGNGEKVDLYMNLSDVAAGMPEVQFKITWRDARLYFWMIDDIVFMEGWDYDLQLLYSEADYDNGTDDAEGFFYAIPHTQLSGYNLHGIVNNFGNIEQWGTHINATVTKNNQIIWDQNSNSITSYPGTIDTLRIDEQFMPDDFGHYQIDFTLESENEDERPFDNAASMPFMVTDSLFSRCDEDAEITFSTWGWYTFQHEGDMMGTMYTLKQDMEINSIAAYISRADILCSFRMVLMGFDEETGDLFELLSSEYIDMDSTILQNHWVTVPLDKDGEGEFLEAGKSYVAAIELWNNMDYEEAYESGRYYLGSDRDNFFPSGTSYMYWSEDDAWYTIGNDLVMTRIHFNDDSNIVDNVDLIQNTKPWLAQNYPNPFKGITNVRYKLVQPGEVKLIIMDQLGKKVFEENLGNQTAGEHEYQLSSEGLDSGIYYYSLSSGNFSETRRMVVK
jgi:hypothetical protein